MPSWLGGNWLGAPLLLAFCSDILFPYRSPSPRPPTPKRTRNGPETNPKQTRNGPERSQTEPNGAEMDRNEAFRGGMGGGFVGVGVRGGGGVVRGKKVTTFAALQVVRRAAAKGATLLRSLEQTQSPFFTAHKRLKHWCSLFNQQCAN